jgi:hypothetical protein
MAVYQREAAIMIKRRFSKPIRGSKSPFFLGSAEEKMEKQFRERAAAADPSKHWIRQWIDPIVVRKNRGEYECPYVFALAS